MSKLENILKVYHTTWVVGEPYSSLALVAEELGKISSSTNSSVKIQPTIWTPATGLLDDSSEWKTQSKQGITDHIQKATLSLISVLMSTSAEGIIVLMDGVKQFLPEIQAACLRVIAEDRRVVFVSTDNPPSDFLRDYIRVVDVGDYELENMVQEICDVNTIEFKPTYMDSLQGLRKSRASSALVEAISMNKSDNTVDISDYLRGSRRESISRDSEGVISLVDPSKCRDFSQLVGLSLAKNILNKLVDALYDNKEVRGVMCVGLPGTGKTVLAKATAKENDLPLYSFDVGSAFGSLVGESERKIIKAIATLKALPSGVVLLDEIEKALASSGKNSSSGDSGVGRRMGGYILNYLEKPESADGCHLIIGTSNDVAVLPPEFTRAGRWDVMFGFTLPTVDQLSSVLSLYRGEYGLNDTFGDSAILDSLVPAEVEAICRIAAVLQTNSWDEAKQYVPVLSTARPEDVREITDWVKGRAVNPNGENGNGKKTRANVRKAR